MKHDTLFVDRFIDILLRHNIIKSQEGKAIKIGFFASSIDDFIEFIITDGLVSKENVLKGLSHYYHVPYFDVVGYFFKHQFLEMFPKDVLLRHEMIPLLQDGAILMMVASEPNNEALLSIIGNYVSYDIQFRVGIGFDIIDSIEEFYDTALTTDTIDAEDAQEFEVRRAIEFLHTEQEKTLDEELERPDRRIK